MILRRGKNTCYKNTKAEDYDDDLFPESVKAPLFSKLEQTVELMDNLQRYNTELSPLPLYRQLAAHKVLPRSLVKNLLSKPGRGAPMMTRHNPSRHAATVTQSPVRSRPKDAIMAAITSAQKPPAVIRTRDVVVCKNRIRIKRNSSSETKQATLASIMYGRRKEYDGIMDKSRIGFQLFRR